jgi:hypothetical protein
LIQQGFKNGWASGTPLEKSGSSDGCATAPNPTRLISRDASKEENPAMAMGAAYRVATTPEHDLGMVSRMTRQLRQFVCGLHGHDALLHFETGRLSLQCTSCGYETPGWNLKEAALTREVGAETRVLRLPMVHQRRVA